MLCCPVDFQLKFNLHFLVQIYKAKVNDMYTVKVCIYDKSYFRFCSVSGEMSYIKEMHMRIPDWKEQVNYISCTFPNLVEQ